MSLSYSFLQTWICDKANKKYIKEQPNPDMTSSYLEYLEASKFSGRTIIQKLPTYGFV